MTARLSDAYFDRMYLGSEDPWQLSTRWYEQRKYSITWRCCRGATTGTRSSRVARSAH